MSTEPRHESTDTERVFLGILIFISLLIVSIGLYLLFEKTETSARSFISKTIFPIIISLFFGQLTSYVIQKLGKKR